LTLVALAGLVLCNCSKDYPIFGKTSGRFPLDQGNWWKLSYEWSYVRKSGPFDSLGTSGELLWDIIDRDVLAGHESYVLRDTYYEETGSTYTSLAWYTDFWKGWEGLFEIGYAWGGSPGPLGDFSGYKFKVAGKVFDSPREVLLWVSGMVPTQGDTTVRIPPRKVLAYPLSLGKKWVAFDWPWLQEREVIDFEDISVIAGIFPCWKIRVLGEVLDQDDIIWYDWFSDQGLVKRYICFEHELLDPYGNPVGTYESKEVYLLESYCID
jgi:hypothetical protein